MGFCIEQQARAFLEGAPGFEKLMVASGIHLLKYWLEVSEEEETRPGRLALSAGSRVPVPLHAEDGGVAPLRWGRGWGAATPTDARPAVTTCQKSHR
jgi:hypothetical protein